MDRVVSSHLTEDGRGRADVHTCKAYPYIQYYDSNGVPFFKETYSGKTIDEVQEIADNWASGVHVLHG